MPKMGIRFAEFDVFIHDTYLTISPLGAVVLVIACVGLVAGFAWLIIRKR